MERFYNLIDIKLMTVLIISIIISTIIWALLYYNSTWFKNKIAEKTNHRILSFLKLSFFKHVASFFVNGGFHSIILLLTILSIFILFKLGKSVNPEPTKIQMVFFRESKVNRSYSSSISRIDMKFIINSDSLYKKSRKNGKSGIILEYDTHKHDSVDYGLVYLQWDKPDSSHIYRDTTLYVEKPCFTLLQSEKDKVAVSIIPAKSDFPGVGPLCLKQDLIIINDSWTPSEDNPYYYYYFTLNFAEAKLFPEYYLNDYKINIEIQVGDTLKNELITLTRRDTIRINNKDTIKVDTLQFEMPTERNTNKNLKFTYINPEPDAITNGRIRYYTKESIKKILYGENITIQAEDIDIMKKKDQKSLLWTVLLGMCVGFLLDVFIQQIRELRNINHEKSSKKKYKVTRRNLSIMKKVTKTSDKT